MNNNNNNNDNNQYCAGAMTWCVYDKDHMSALLKLLYNCEDHFHL